MLVLAAVPDVQFHKLRRAAGSRLNVAQVSTWDDVLTSIRGRPVELAVVDPLLSGQRRSQELARRGPDGGRGRGARAGSPAHLRTVVHAGRVAVAAALPLRSAGAVRAPPAAGSGLHDRGRGETAGLRADQDSAIARARVPRAHGRRNAPVPRLERGIGARGPALSHPARGPGLRFMSATPRTVLVVDDEAPLRRVLERSL